MKGSSRKTMLLAFLLAAVAAAAVYFLLAGRGARNPETDAPATTVETVPVLVAARDIPADTELTLADVELDRISPDGRHPDALTDPEAAVGMVTSSNLVLGEQVLSQRLLAPQDALPKTFARDVPPGYRAITINGDEVKLVGGLVQPGDRVDIVGYFEFQKDTAATGGGAEATSTPENAEPVINEPTPTAGPGAANPAAALYVLQDVEVMSVAQALTPSDLGVSADGAAPADAAANAAKDVTAGTGNDPVARPEAGSITLLVPAGDVARLLLAVNTVPDDASLRLVLRAPGDTGLTVQQPVVTTEDAAPYQFGDVAAAPGSPLRIVSVEFLASQVLTGDDLAFTVTVKNVSGETVNPGVGGAPDGFAYPEDSAWDEEGFFEDDGNLRIGLNVAGAAEPYPWRWTLAEPLEPGQTATLTGAVTMEHPTTGKRFWFGVIDEPQQVLEDGIGVAEIRVSLPRMVLIAASGADLREEPNAEAAVAVTAAAGAELPVADRRQGWYKVVAPDGAGWVEASMVEPVPATASEPEDAPQTGAAATPVAAGE